MLLFNQSGSPTEFDAFATNVATVLKEMRQAGLEETTMGEVLIWLGKEEEEIDDDAWEHEFVLEDSLLELDVDRIVAGITDRLH